jgi:hypothetical protein
MNDPVEILLPPVKVWFEGKPKAWCWTAPNGASGTHEASARNAAITAISGMGVDLRTVTLPDPPLASPGPVPTGNEPS